MVVSKHDAATNRAPKTLREYLAGPPPVTQKTLADRAHVHQTSISLLVRKKRRPRAELALRLHRITGVPLDELLSPKRRPHRRTRPPEPPTTTTLTTDDAPDVVDRASVETTHDDDVDARSDRDARFADLVHRS